MSCQNTSPFPVILEIKKNLFICRIILFLWNVRYTVNRQLVTNSRLKFFTSILKTYIKAISHSWHVTAVQSDWNARRNLLHGGQLAPIVELNLIQTDVPTWTFIVNRIHVRVWSGSLAELNLFVGHRFDPRPGVLVWRFCPFMWPCDKWATCPGCNPAFVPWQLVKADPHDLEGRSKQVQRMDGWKFVKGERGFLILSNIK